MLFVWLTSLVLPVFGAGHGMGLDDPACERPLWSRSQSTTPFSLDTDVRTVDDGHCGICHLQRAVRGALHSAARTVDYTATIATDRPTGQYDLAGSDRDIASPRGPPFLFA